MLKIAFQVFSFVFISLCVVAAQASIDVIGTANYFGTDYNLIYESEQNLVWLDFTTTDPDDWIGQMNWAAGINGALTVNLNPGYTSSIDWSNGWRLPSAGPNPQQDYDQITSEMGHLYYISLDELEFGVTAPFENLWKAYYWSGTEDDELNAWNFQFVDGNQHSDNKPYARYAIAVRPGEVSVVPIPGAIWLLGSGIIGLAGLRRRFKK